MLRFTVTGDCVTDNLTGLMWTKNANFAGGTKTWEEAIDYVASLNSSGGLGGYTDWRLPNPNEILIANEDEEECVDWLRSQGFINVMDNFYWSTVTYVTVAGDIKSAWAIHPSGGFLTDEKTSQHYIWPVRG